MGFAIRRFRSSMLGRNVAATFFLCIAVAHSQRLPQAPSLSGKEPVRQAFDVAGRTQAIPATLTNTPVVLLNGWQPGPPTDSCPKSSPKDTFGSLTSSLDLVQIPWLFFDNCVQCPNCTIEELGDVLGRFLASQAYDNGAPVTRFDLVTH